MDKYERLGVLGEGSYGVVTKCRHKETGQVGRARIAKQEESILSYKSCSHHNDNYVDSVLYSFYIQAVLISERSLSEISLYGCSLLFLVLWLDAFCFFFLCRL
jgi:serine/threonine protein kinase